MTLSWQEGRGKMVGNLIRSGQKINDDLNNLGDELKKGSAFPLNMQFRFLITGFKKLLQLNKQMHVN